MRPALRSAARRLALGIPMLFVVAVATFFLEQLVPGDPGADILGQGATRAQIHQLDASLGLERSLPAQFGSWLGNAVRGDFGSSWTTRQPVAHSIAASLPVTLSLALVALAATVVLGVVLGTAAALRPGAVDRTIQGVAGTATALPAFWIGVALVLALSVKVQLLPATGYVPLTSSPWQWFRSLVLPVVALSLGPATALALQVRSAMLDGLRRDYIRSLRAAGLSRRSVVYKHALRNAVAPVVTVVGFLFVGLLAGAVVIEELFDLPGLGQVLVTSVVAHDVPLVQGTVMVFAAIVVLVNVAVDTAVVLLNPRARRA